MKKIFSHPAPIIYLMGPTAAGKTPLAVEIVKRFPCEIISVDSAMVYRQMDIGTAKPTAEILKIAPHRLINLLDPKEIYSAGQFRQDALTEIDDILSRGNIPLLVGGTLLYFRVLQQGLASLPRADQHLRAELQAQAQREGWESLHAILSRVDPDAGKRIHINDSQRIQRALEVFLLTNKTITAWQADTHPLSGYRMHPLILAPTDRAVLHERIAKRFAEMLELGFLEEVTHLFIRGDLTKTLPSIRSVGYSEVWDYLAGEYNYAEMCNKAIIATRKLAKRQLTWLRPWKDALWLDAESTSLIDDTMRWLQQMVGFCSK